VEVAVEALGRMLARPGMARDRIFNLGNPAYESTIRGLAERMRAAAAEVTGDASYLGLPLAEVSALEFYGEGYADSDRRMPRIDKALRLLEWRPRQGLDAILRRTLADAFRIHRPAREG
jgi:nucleoside-diphosphate-sugar epimerase